MFHEQAKAFMKKWVECVKNRKLYVFILSVVDASQTQNTSGVAVVYVSKLRPKGTRTSSCSSMISEALRPQQARRILWQRAAELREVDC